MPEKREVTIYDIAASRLISMLDQDNQVATESVMLKLQLAGK